MIARWKERTVRRPSVGRSVGRSPADCLYSKTCRRIRSLPTSLPRALRIVLPASFLYAATGNVSINLSLSQDPFAPFGSLVPRPSPPLRLFWALLLLLRLRLSPLWYSPPLCVRGKNGFKRSISDSLAAAAAAAAPPLLTASIPGARPPSCFDSEKTEGETETEMAAVDGYVVEWLVMAGGPERC